MQWGSCYSTLSMQVECVLYPNAVADLEEGPKVPHTLILGKKKKKKSQNSKKPIGQAKQNCPTPLPSLRSRSESIVYIHTTRMINFL